MKKSLKTKTPDQQKFNPCFTIWQQPKKTIHSCLEQKSMNLAIYTATLAGIAITFRYAIPADVAATMNLSAILVVIFLIGVIGGLIAWFLGAGILLAIGKGFNGKASFAGMLIAHGIALIPIAASVILCILDFIILREAAFQHMILSTPEAIWLAISNVVSMILFIWSASLLVQSIAVTHSIRIQQAICTLALPTVLIILLFVIIRSSITVW